MVGTGHLLVVLEFNEALMNQLQGQQNKDAKVFAKLSLEEA